MELSRLLPHNHPTVYIRCRPHQPVHRRRPSVRYCPEPGCSAKVKRGRCQAHQRRRFRVDALERGTASERGYDHTWRKLRDLKIKTDPLCEPCTKQGRTRPAVEVDHVVPLNDGGPRLEWSNLQSICRSCHARKTQGERG